MVSAGILISLTRVLTTCDSVGFFTGKKVNLYQFDKVSIMAGSIHKNGTGGEYQSPISGRVHRFCYFLSTMSTVLFNYGFYEVATPFGSAATNRIEPVPMAFESGADMELTLRSMWMGDEKLKCHTAGWGNPSKQFEGNGMPDHFERFSPTLQAAAMTVVHYSDCYQSICDHFEECLISIWEYGFVCAKASEGGPCNEDNGAPLVCEGQVFAIHTNPHRCLDEGLPRLFLRLDLAYEFVFDVESGSNTRRHPSFTLLGTMLVSWWLQAAK